MRDLFVWSISSTSVGLLFKDVCFGKSRSTMPTETFLKEDMLIKYMQEATFYLNEEGVLFIMRNTVLIAF